MNQKNFEFLKDQLKFTGFGERLEGALKEKLAKGETEFKIQHEITFGKDSLAVDLNFKKSDQSDMYFFNTYGVNLHKDQAKEGLEQTFYINKDSNITLKEAYNLMEGRAVNKDLKDKEGQVYNAWLKMDFKEADSNGNFKINHYHQNYGYDLEASVSKHPIKELLTPEHKDDLLNSLKKGNIQSVTFVVDGEEKKQFVEANPQFKTVNIYDSAMQRINHRESKDQKQGQDEGKTAAKDVKQREDLSSGEPQEGAQKNKQKTRKAQSL